MYLIDKNIISEIRKKDKAHPGVQQFFTWVDADHALDKQIAATALIHDLTVVTRNQSEFIATGVRVLNPFAW